MTLIELRERVRVRRGLPEPEERRRLREAAGISQTELAAAIGVSPAAISYWESGKRTPQGETRERYVAALGIFREARSAGSA